MLVMILITIFEATKNEGKKNMLETSQERVKLLKAGISTKTIEHLYLKSNCFKIIGIPTHYNGVAIIQETKIEPNFL